MHRRPGYEISCPSGFPLCAIMMSTFARSGPEELARFLGLHVDDVFPITVDVRRYVRGDPALLTTIKLKEPQERLTREERWALG
jgi:hypothetical protein